MANQEGFGYQPERSTSNIFYEGNGNGSPNVLRLRPTPIAQPLLPVGVNPPPTICSSGNGLIACCQDSIYFVGNPWFHFHQAEEDMEVEAAAEDDDDDDDDEDDDDIDINNEEFQGEAAVDAEAIEGEEVEENEDDDEGGGGIAAPNEGNAINNQQGEEELDAEENEGQEEDAEDIGGEEVEEEENENDDNGGGVAALNEGNAINDQQGEEELDAEENEGQEEGQAAAENEGQEEGQAAAENEGEQEVDAAVDDEIQEEEEDEEIEEQEEEAAVVGGIEDDEVWWEGAAAELFEDQEEQDDGTDDEDDEVIDNDSNMFLDNDRYCRLPYPPEAHFPDTCQVVLCVYDQPDHHTDVFDVICIIERGENIYHYNVFSSFNCRWKFFEDCNLWNGSIVPNSGTSCLGFAYWLFRRDGSQTPNSLLRVYPAGRERIEDMTSIMGLPLSALPPARLQLGRVGDRLGLVSVNEVSSKLELHTLYLENGEDPWALSESFNLEIDAEEEHGDDWVASWRENKTIVCREMPRPIRFESFKVELLFWVQGRVVLLENHENDNQSYRLAVFPNDVPAEIIDGVPHVYSSDLPKDYIATYRT